MHNKAQVTSIIITIFGTSIREAIGPFAGGKEAADYLAAGNGPRDATQMLIVPLSPLGLYIHPKFPRLVPVENINQERGDE